MSEKFVFSGTSNDGFRHKYHINKCKGFRKTFYKFMLNLGFEDKETINNFYEKYESSEEDEEYISVQWMVDADEITDEVWHFKNEKYEVDVFFGDQKVFVIVQTNGRKNMTDFLKKNSIWKSDEEFERIRNENREKMKKRALEELQKRSKPKMKVKVKSKK